MANLSMKVMELIVKSIQSLDISDLKANSNKGLNLNQLAKMKAISSPLNMRLTKPLLILLKALSNGIIRKFLLLRFKRE